MEHIRGRDRSNLKTEIKIGFNLQGAYAYAIGDMHRGELKDSDGKKTGEGVVTSIFLIQGNSFRICKRQMSRRKYHQRIQGLYWRMS